MPDKKWRLFKDRSAWRCWLESNHDRAKEIRLVYYKKNSGKKSVRYEDALEEALCFGWIDSVVNRVDDERYMGWIESAKRPETRARRIAETVRRVEAGRKAGM